MGEQSSSLSPGSLPILTTGDVVLDRQVYEGDRLFPNLPGKVAPHISSSAGGAFMLHSIIEACVEEEGLGKAGCAFGLADVAPGNIPDHLCSFTLWQPCPGGLKKEHEDAPADQKPKLVWRTQKALGYSLPSQATFPFSKSPAADAPCSVLAIDDANLGFRTFQGRKGWPAFASLGKSPSTGLIILKMSNPLAEGDLWRSLVYSGPESAPIREKLVIVVSADELRRAGAAISTGFSWEQTLSELCRELDRHPQLHALLQNARHVVVNFGCVASVWFGDPVSTHGADRPATAQERARLVYDPTLAEGDWERCLMDSDPKCDHRVYGHLNVVTAALAFHVREWGGATTETRTELFTEGLRRGLTAARQLRRIGHGTVSAASPAFPYKAVASVIVNAPAAKELPALIKLLAPNGYRYISASEYPMESRWSLAALSENPPHRQTVPLYGLAHRVALFGEPALEHIPHARFGDMLSIDREEIETLRGLSRMIRDYENGGRRKQPLCLAAFGPPGAGKSFGIKQIARQVLDEKDPLEFNLSQYSDPSELIGAFHQVRDRVLQGKTPVVFWDEFDASGYKWLQYLLAPMQDGSFQEEGHTHTLGKCVFVFAGATSWDFEHFGPAPMPSASDSDAHEELKQRYDDRSLRKAEEEANADFRRKKGPDFISRLDGHINVLGPNQRLTYDWKQRLWLNPDACDISFPVRRALLLRTFLGLKKGKDRLAIDRDLLRAFLLTPRYRHGARSLEKIARPLALSHVPFRRAHLPPPQVLEQHLETAVDFDALYHGNRDFLTASTVQQIAAAIDENYERHINPNRTRLSVDQFTEAFQAKMASADPWQQWLAATNIAASTRLPDILALVGLHLVQGSASPSEQTSIIGYLEKHLEILAREEHDLWMEFHKANGWRQASKEQVEVVAQCQAKSAAAGKAEIKRLKREERVHTLLVPFDDLPDNEKAKDHDAIRNYPETVALVGWKIAFTPD